MKQREMWHAVMRHDRYARSIEDAITIVAVVPTKDEAMSEVERLSSVNAGKDSSYFWLPARLFPDGRGVAPNDPDGGD